MTKRTQKKPHPITPIDATLQLAEAFRIWNPDGSQPLDTEQRRARSERDRIVAEYNLHGHEDALAAAMAEALAEFLSASRRRSVAGDGGKRKIGKLERALADADDLMGDVQVHNRLVASILNIRRASVNTDGQAAFAMIVPTGGSGVLPEMELLELRLVLRKVHKVAEAARAMKGNPGKALRRVDQDAAAGPLIAFWEGNAKRGTVHRMGGGVSRRRRDGSEGSTSQGTEFVTECLAVLGIDDVTVRSVLRAKGRQPGRRKRTPST